MIRATTKVVAITLLAIASVLAVPTTAGAAAPAAGAGAFTLTMPEGGGSLHISGSENDEALGTPTTVTGTVDPTTGAISAGAFATPTISFQQQITDPITATVFIDASFSEVSPNSATGSIDSDGNVIVQDAMAVSLHIEVGDPAIITADCQSKPVNLTLQSTAPYDPDTNTVTLADPNFTIPPVIDETACTSLIQGPINDQLAGSGNSLTMTLNGELPVPEAASDASTTSLAVTPTGGAHLGSPVTMAANVAPGADADSQAAPTGFVDFLDGTTVVDTGQLSNGSATVTTSSLTAGSHSLTAHYRGDSNYASSTSTAVSYRVAAPPSVTADIPSYLEMDAAPSPFGVTVDNSNDSAVTNARLDMTITPPPGVFSSMAPSDFAVQYQADDGSWKPVTLTGGGTGRSNVALVGSLGSPTGFPLPEDGSVSVPVKLAVVSGGTFPTEPGPIVVTIDLVPVDADSGAPTPQRSPAPTAIATAASNTTIVEAHRVPTTINTSGGSNPSPHTVRMGNVFGIGMTVDKAPTASFQWLNPSGTLSFAIDGRHVDARYTSTDVADGYEERIPLGGLGDVTIALPSWVAVGTHQVEIQYSGDAVFLPAHTTLAITVVPALGPVYSCAGSGPLPTLFNVNMVAHANLPPSAAPGTVALDHPTITMLADRGEATQNNLSSFLGTGPVDVGDDPSPGLTLAGIDFDLGPGGSGTATSLDREGDPMPAQPNPATDVDQPITLGGISGTALIAGAPGTSVPVTLDHVEIDVTSPFFGDIDFNCTPVGDAAILGNVTVAGTSLDVTPTQDPTVTGNDVTLTATVAPSGAGGTVFFRDGDATVGVAPVSSDGTATLTTDNLAAGDHHLTAVWSGNLSLPSSTSPTVDLTVYPDVACPTDATPGSPATVRWVYLSLLGRCPDPGGLAYWTGLLDGGANPSAVANSLTHSGESVRRVVNGAYQTVLGRQADPGGLAYWTSQVTSGHLGYQDLLVQLTSSNEFYNASGATPEGFVENAYQVILGRGPESAGKAYWVNQLANGASRATVAHSVAFSHESATRIVADAYNQELQSVPTGADLTNAVAAFEADSNVPNLLARIIGAPEFATFAQGYPELPQP